MMAIKKMRQIGKIKSAHGLKGEVYVLIYSKDSSWLDKVGAFYVASDTTPESEKVKLGIKSFRPHKEGVLIFFDNIENRNQSEAIVGKQVWVEQSAFVSENNEPIYLLEIEDFIVSDLKLGAIGRIKGFSSNNGQDLLLVETTNAQKKSEAFEIPFVDAFVIKMDMQKQILYTDLPEGLLEINNSDSTSNEEI